jgi:serine/threonine protein kinase
VTNGTPYYVAPEVVANGMLEKNSDVYSFGVLMWELYRCMPPWVKTETGYSLNKRFRRFPVDTPRIYVALCARCLDSKPKNRPPFPEVLAELESMHNAYLMGYDNLEEPPPSFVVDSDEKEIGSGIQSGSGSGSRGSPRRRTHSNQRIAPPAAQEIQGQPEASGSQFARSSEEPSDSIKIPVLPAVVEAALSGIDEEAEVIADEAGVVSMTRVAAEARAVPVKSQRVSMDARGKLTRADLQDEGVISQGLNPPPRSQNFVQYFTSKQIREHQKKAKGSGRESES